MSLINDALKRARQAQLRQPPPAAGASMQPAEQHPRPWAGPVVVRPVVLLLVTLSCWFLWMWWKQTDQPAPRTRAAASGPLPAAQNPATGPAPSIPSPPSSSPERGSETPAAAQTANAADLATKPAPSNSASVAAPGSQGPAAPGPETTNHLPATASSTGESAAPGAPAVSPPLKLQGIFHRAQNPVVMINNQTVGLGEEVDGARVVVIERDHVKVEIGGKTNTLTLR